jgi:hypothetical protein
MSHVWMRHVGLPGEEGHGNPAQFDEAAVDDWRAMGWEPCEAPEEFNPVVAENLAAQKAAAEEAVKADKKPSRKGGTDTTSQE